MQHLQNRTAIITGASRGIGEATARLFAAQGARLVLLARSGDRLDALAADLETTGTMVRTLAGDVADYAVLESAVDTAVSSLGSLDFLINNAGVIEPIARIADSDPAAWSQVVDINLKGVYNGIRAALPPMLAAGEGVIVNLSSGAATGALEGWSHYCATKAAVLSLTRCTHKEYAAAGICSVGISPGTVATDMQDEIRESGVNPVSQLPATAHIPSEWVARAIAFLCGPEGASYAGGDFSLKNDDGRRAVGLPPIDN